MSEDLSKFGKASIIKYSNPHTRTTRGHVENIIIVAKNNSTNLLLYVVFFIGEFMSVK